ncbi:hypothetical protein, partial [Xenorhabdus bovienii]|uniref:hypothetical protein n=1 Tax=Xenorhabdus bovienii TaxID=40576 RepID=UPI0023B23C98
LVEHLPYKEGVISSNLVLPTTSSKHFQPEILFPLLHPVLHNFFSKVSNQSVVFSIPLEIMNNSIEFRMSLVTRQMKMPLA